MAIQFVGSRTVNGNSGVLTCPLSGLTGGIDTEARAGDFVVASYAAVSTANLSLVVGDGTWTSPTGLWANDTRDANLRVATKLMTGSPDTQVQGSGNTTATNGASLKVRVYRGVDPTNPLDVAIVTATGTNSAIPNPGSITPVTNNSMIVIIGAGSGAAVDSAVTVPAGYGNQVLDTIDPGNAIIHASADRLLAVAAAEDPAAWTGWTTSTSDGWCAITLALRPAPDPVFDDFRQAIIDGLVSAQSEVTGWNAQRANIPVTAVVRTSATVVTITLPALGAYDITAAEVITATIPGAVLTGGSAIVASPTIDIATSTANQTANPSAIPITVTLPVATRVAGPVTRGATAIPVTVSPGTATTAAVARATATAIPVTVTPGSAVSVAGGVSRSATSIPVTVTPGSATLVPGGVSRAATSIPVAVVPGSAIAVSGPVVRTGAAIPVNVTLPVADAVSGGGVTVGAPIPVTVSPGSASVVVGPVSRTATAIPVSVVPGTATAQATTRAVAMPIPIAVSLAATAVAVRTVTGMPIPISVAPGAAISVAGAITRSATAIPITVTFGAAVAATGNFATPIPITVSLPTATAVGRITRTATAIPVAITMGAATRLMIATATPIPISVSIPAASVAVGAVTRSAEAIVVSITLPIVEVEGGVPVDTEDHVPMRRKVRRRRIYPVQEVTSWIGVTFELDGVARRAGVEEWTIDIVVASDMQIAGVATTTIDLAMELSSEINGRRAEYPARTFGVQDASGAFAFAYEPEATRIVDLGGDDSELAELLLLGEI